MAKICFVVHAELGHIIPTLRLADDLARRGHEIVYLSAPAYAELLQSHGFAVELIWDGWFTSEFERMRAIGSESERARAWQRFVTAYIELMLGDRLEAAIHAGGYDMIISDIAAPAGAVIAWSLGLPCIQYVVSTPADAAPPGPDRDEQIRDSIARQERAVAEFEATFPAITELLPRLFSRYGYREEWLDAEDRCMGHHCTTAVAYLFLCPPALIADPATWQRYQFCQSLPRPPAGPWHPGALESNQVCLSFGSNGARYPSATRVANALVGAMAHVEGFHMTALGLPSTMVSEHAGLGNVEFPGFISQRDLLSQGVRLMCSHGGLGTFKECAYHGTPLLVTPFTFDQPINARFVEALGIGVAVDPDASSERVRHALDQVLHDDTYAAAASALAQQVRGFEREESGAALVESHLP